VAKLKAPLLSLGASGQLGKSLVYFPWKGLDLVREYVIPTNPNTSAQQTQRGYVDLAVTLIHEAMAAATHPLDEADKSAYSLLASTYNKPMTWFNMATKQYLDVVLLAKVPIIFRDFTISDTIANSIDLIVYLSEETAAQLAAGKFYFGTSKTALLNTKAATIVASTSAALAASDCSAFLTAGNDYYVQFRADAADPCEYTRSGIYKFTAS
jgi:hypothetical protein